MPLKIAFHTFGCKLNQMETEAVAELFAKEGFEISDVREADLFFVNTCAVTGKAEAKSRKYLRRLAQQHPGQVIAAGCLAQAKPAELAEAADFKMILGTSEKGDAVRLEAKDAGFQVYVAAKPRGSFIEGGGNRFRSRSFIKIQDGCDHRCAYCIVPKLRGASVSLPVQDVARQVEDVLSGEPREIVLTGVDIGSYREGKSELSDLLEVLLSMDDLIRIRLSSVEPPGFTHRLLEICASSPEICPHVHLPLQSGSDAVLQRVGREYSAGDYLELVNDISHKIPEARIGADVIVGLPGEGDKEFRETAELLEKSPITHLHVFPFSWRPGTKFERRDDIVPASEKAARSRKLRNIAARKNNHFLQSQTGKIRTVFFEENGSGFTDNYIRVVMENCDLRGFHDIELLEIHPRLNAVWGRLIE